MVDVYVLVEVLFVGCGVLAVDYRECFGYQQAQGVESGTKALCPVRTDQLHPGYGLVKHNLHDLLLHINQLREGTIHTLDGAHLHFQPILQIQGLLPLAGLKPILGLVGGQTPLQHLGTFQTVPTPPPLDDIRHLIHDFGRVEPRVLLHEHVCFQYGGGLHGCGLSAAQEIQFLREFVALVGLLLPFYGVGYTGDLSHRVMGVARPASKGF